MIKNKQQTLAISLQQQLSKMLKKSVYRDKQLVMCYQQINEILSQQRNDIFSTAKQIYAYVQTHYLFRIFQTKLQCKTYFYRNNAPYNFHGHQIIHYLPILEEYFNDKNIIFKTSAQNQWKNIYLNFQTKFSISQEMFVKHKLFMNQILNIMQKLETAIRQLFAVFESQITSKKQFVSSISDIIKLLDITDDKYELTKIQKKIPQQKQLYCQQQQQVTTTYSIKKINKQVNIDNNKFREIVKPFKGNNLVEEKLVLQQKILVQPSINEIPEKIIPKGHTLIMVRTPTREQIQQIRPNLSQNQLQTINKYFTEKFAKNYECIIQFRHQKLKVNHYIFSDPGQQEFINNIFFLDYYEHYFQTSGPPSQESLCQKLQLLQQYITLIQHNAQKKFIHSNMKPSNLLIKKTSNKQILLMNDLQNARRCQQYQLDSFSQINLNSKINMDPVFKQFRQIMINNCGKYEQKIIQKYYLQDNFSDQKFTKYVKIVLKMLIRTIHSTQPNLRPPLVKKMLQKLQSYMRYRQISQILDPQITITKNQISQFISKFYDFYGFTSIIQSICQRFMPPLYSRKLLDNFGQIAVMKLLGLGEHIEKQILEMKIQNIQRIRIILKVLKEIGRKLNKQELTKYLNAVN